MGHIGKAIGIGLLYFTLLVVIPLGFIGIVSSFIGSSGGDPSKYFHHTGMYALALGVLTTIFASLGAYYDKGSGKRLAFALTSSIFLALWGYLFIGSMSIYYEGDTYAYEVLVPGIAIALALSLSFKIIYRIVEYHVYKDEYRSGNGQLPPAEPPYMPQSGSEEEMYF